MMTEHPFIAELRSVDAVARVGRVCQIQSTFIEADGPALPLGALCRVEARSGATGADRTLLAEVVAVRRDAIALVPFEADPATYFGARVTACADALGVPVGDALAGRALDPLARPIDGAAPLLGTQLKQLDGATPTALSRTTPDQILETGVRAIDGLLTLGRGQRVGIFAAAGVGKTSLLTQLATQVGADRCVICLVGERGREVEALWSESLSADVRARTTLIAATSDQAAAMRVRACDYALAIADHWRSQGQHVLLLLDSVTRLAMALREIGLAAGEPPTVRGYTPSVFAAIPKLVERCGALKSSGSITAVMTVLAESDDVDDPVSEMMKSLLDGHIVLSRSLAEQGHHPAIDVPRSISRLANRLMPKAHREDAMRAVKLLSTYEESRTLIEAGVYALGSNAEIDLALERRPALLQFLQQSQHQRVPYPSCCESLANLVAGIA